MFLVYVICIRNKAFNFLWFKFMIKKSIVMTQIWVNEVINSIAGM